MKWIVIILIIVTVLIFFTSCHSNQINLTYKGESGASFEYKDSTKIAFVGKKKAYLRAKGIAAFPDGGQPKYLVQATGIYVLDSKKNELNLLVDITEQNKLSWRIHRGKIKLIYMNDQVFYKWDLKPLSVDNTEAYEVLDKQYFDAYSIDINTKEISVIDTDKFESLYEKFYKKCDLTKLHNNLDKIPLADWGLVLQEIKSKSDKKFIKDIVEFKSKSKITRRAIIEQIISKKDPQEIEDILKRLDNYYNSLKGYEKAKQTIHYDETYKSIQELL